MGGARTRSKLRAARVRVGALRAQVDGLLISFQQQGFADPRAATHLCLQSSLEACTQGQGAACRREQHSGSPGGSQERWRHWICSGAVAGICVP